MNPLKMLYLWCRFATPYALVLGALLFIGIWLRCPN